MKSILFITTVMLAACATSSRTKHEFANKKVTSVEKISLVTVEGSKGKYMVPSDTIKVNDVVPVIFKTRY